jgi:hypothetical protein
VLEQCDDLVVVVDGCESADSVNECIGIANGFYVGVVVLSHGSVGADRA